MEESLIQIGRQRTPQVSLQQELTEGLLVLRLTLKQSEPNGGTLPQSSLQPQSTTVNKKGNQLSTTGEAA